jgi:hypothetical protein
MLDTTGLACASNPCFGDSFCIDLAGNAICICEDGKKKFDKLILKYKRKINC